MSRRQFSTYDSQIRHQILEHGWSIQMVGMGICVEPGCGDSASDLHDPEPPYAYTVGLTRFDGHPEIITFGLCMEHLGETLNVLGEAVRAGIDVTDPGFLDELFQPGTARMITVEDSSGHLLVANRFYRVPGHGPVPALQLVWADGQGLFPWDFGFAEGGWPQPLLGVAA
jgi:hypothetical protein